MYNCNGYNYHPHNGAVYDEVHSFHYEEEHPEWFYNNNNGFQNGANCWRAYTEGFERGYQEGLRQRFCRQRHCCF